MEKQIAVIGSGATTESIEAILKAKGMDNVIVVSADIPIAEPTMPAPIMLRPPEIWDVKCSDYKDGKTLRRERRKADRKRQRNR